MKEKTTYTELDLGLIMESSDLSKAEYNFVCVKRICANVIKMPLIDVLTHHISPIELHKKIPSCSMLVTGKNKLSPDQLKYCFLQPPLLPDYNTFDFTLLYDLIRHLCPSLKPSQRWGIVPKCMDTLIGDEIERLRILSVYMYLCSTRVSDGEFEEFINCVRNVVRRFQNITRDWSKYNYEEELIKVVQKKLEYKYPKKEEELEKVQLTFMPSQCFDKKDEPVMLINGPEEVICGSTIRLMVNVEPANTTEWLVNWQKNRTGATELISIRNKKYISSHDRQLVINCVEREDEGKYQAFLSRESNGNIHKCIYSLPQKERPCFDAWNITTEIRGITIYYKVSDCSPHLDKIKWMKNGQNLDLRNEKYVGGGLNDGFITILSPTEEDRGTYSCTVTNAVGSVSKNVTLDIPNANIVTDSEIVFGSKTTINATISSCPSICGLEWQKGIDRNNFIIINAGDPKHVGSSLNPILPLLVITNTTFDDVQHYRLRVWNKIGEHFSNTLHLNVTGKPPAVSTFHTNCFETRSVELIGNVSVIDKYPKVDSVYWTKNGEKIDPQIGGRKYSKGSVKSPSLTIHNVNNEDAGSYELTATNAVGSNKSDIVLGVPEIYIERRENPDGSRCFTAKINSIPEAYHVQWKVKRNGHEEFSLIDVNDPDYKGTSNSIHCPVLVVKDTELLKNQCFYIKVDNFIGSSIEEIFDIPICYLFYKPADDFDHFYYIYKLIRDCESRVEKILCSKGQKNNFTSKDVVIKIGIAGHFHENDLNFIAGGTWKETVSEDQQIWNVSPLLCFQHDLSLESIFKIVRKISAHHRIIITSNPTCNEAIEAADPSIIFVCKTRQEIKKAITISLEKPFHQILQKWFEDLRNVQQIFEKWFEGFINYDLSKFASEIIAEIKDIRKYLDFEKSKNLAVVSGLQGGGTEFIVPDNVKDYLFRMPSVNSFGIWEKLSFKVFVKKGTDEKKLKKNLLKMNKDFFDKFHLEIVKGNFLVKKTLKQGDPLLSGIPDDYRLFNKGTLGGFVRKIDDKKKIYALTCNHIFPKEKQLAYTNDSNGFREMGTCVFTTREKACDFAAIELRDSFLDGCDVTVRREDKKKVNAKIYTGSLHNVGLVHKIGAATDVTSGRIMSLEYYDKEMDSHCRDNIFLVKGLNGPFSEEGDSGSLVFCRPNSVIQNHVNVLGMVFAQNIKTNCDGDDDAFNVEDNLSICYRINTALELFKENQGEGFEVNFQDDLSVNLSSLSSQSFSSED